MYPLAAKAKIGIKKHSSPLKQRVYRKELVFFGVKEIPAQ
jgi:hypothetical protein